MAEYAPQAILWLASQAVAQIPSAKFSGVVGDKSHTFGYHRGRNYLPADDYSRELAEDKAGDGEAASALDLSYSAPQMKVITARLIKSADDPDDLRLNFVREFYGTVDGVSVVGRDTYYGNFAASDDSHLWHVHISFLRKYANSLDAMRAVLSVLIGETYAQYLAAGGTSSGGGTVVAFDEVDPNFGNGKENLYSVYRILLALLDGRESVDNLYWKGIASAKPNGPHVKLNELIARPGVVLDSNQVAVIAQQVTVAVVDALRPMIGAAVADELARRMQE